MSAASSSAVPANTVGPQSTQDAVFAEAVEKFTTSLSAPLRERFFSFKDIGPDAAMELARKFDNDHAAQSRSRRVSARIAPFLKAISRYGSILTVFVSYSPDPAALVWGGVMCILKIGSEFPTYFEKVTTLFEEVASILKPLSKYSKEFVKANSGTRESLLLLYEDVLELLKTGMAVFVDDSGKKRAGLKTFFLSQWKPFEIRFGDLQARFRNHVTQFERENTVFHQNFTHKEVQEQQKFRDATSSGMETLQKQMSSSSKLQDKEFKAQIAFRSSMTYQLEQVRKDNQIQISAARIEKRLKAMHWLSALSFEDEIEQCEALRHQSTGLWLFETSEYTKFLSTPTSSLLWCQGKPGCGKTIISALTVRTWQGEADLNDRLLAYVFCSSANTDKSDTTSLLASILCQLSRQHEAVLSLVEDLHQSAIEAGEVKASLRSLRNTFRQIANLPLLILIDALDECHNHEIFLPVLTQMVHDDAAAKILITSRHGYKDIDNQLGQYATIHIDQSRVHGDLEAWMISQVAGLRDMNPVFKVHEDLEPKVSKAIIEKADGMFLWARFQLESLRYQTTKNQVMKALETLPEGLDPTYDRAMATITRQHESHRNLALKILMWTAYARFPLEIDEMVEVLAMEPGSTTVDPANRVVDEQLLTTVCAGLIVIPASSRTVTLSHSSVRDYLQQSFKLVTSMIDHKLIQSIPYQVIGECCLNYLIYDRESLGDWRENLRPARFEALRLARPFRIYAHRWWALYISHQQWESVFAAKILDIVTDEVFRQASSAVHQHVGDGNLYPQDASPVHILAREGLTGILESISNIHDFLGAVDDRDRTPLHSSCVEGWYDTSKILVERGASMDCCDADRNTPLHLAAISGNGELVEFLVQKGADVSALNRLGQTPLAKAVLNNSVTVLPILLKAGSRLIRPDDEHDIPENERFSTPLWIAAARNNLAMGKVLIEAGCDVNDVDIFGSVLHSAAREGHLDFVNLLLQHGANPNQTELWKDFNITGFGTSPLHAAIVNSHVAVARRLLKANAHTHIEALGWNIMHSAACSDNSELLDMALTYGYDINAVINHGVNMTALRIAGVAKSETAMLFMLEHGADPNLQAAELPRDGNKDSAESRLPAICLAADAGFVSVVQRLIAAGAYIDRKASDAFDIEALGVAARAGSLKIARILVEAGADIDARDVLRWTPLMRAARSDSVEVFDYLLSTGADLFCEDYLGLSVLHLAALGDKTGIMTARLLSAGIDPNLRTPNGLTPLIGAVVCENQAGAAELLKAGADPRLKDDDGLSALHYAAKEGSSQLVELLLTQAEDGLSIDIDDIFVVNGAAQTALHVAVRHGRTEAVRCLLAHGAESAHRCDDPKLGPVTAFQLACARDDLDTVKALIELGVAYDMPDDTTGRRALHLACMEGSKSVIHQLILNGVSVDVRDGYGVTPLMYAVSVQNRDCVIELLAHGAEPDLEAIVGRAAMDFAITKSDAKMTDLLLKNGATINVYDNEGNVRRVNAAELGQMARIGVELAEETPTAIQGDETEETSSDESPEIQDGVTTLDTEESQAQSATTVASQSRQETESG